MSFDNSRYTFDPSKNYSGVVMQQGRVQLDSDWNEWLAEQSRRMQAGTLDMLGQAVYPPTTPYAFQITAQNNEIFIGPGRMYVDGLLAENHGDVSADSTTAVWDPALAELSNAPQPPPAPPSSGPPTGSISYTNQPYLLNAAISGDPPFLAYLDVWTRPITYLEDSELIDPAVGIDTTGRLQTVWQVKLMPSPGGSTSCPTSNAWWPAPSAGLLTTGTLGTSPPGPCCLTSQTGFTGQENQFYRVEIHQPGPAGTATFKWSRDNGSVMTGITAITAASNSAGNPASKLTVLSLGRDQMLGFAPGNWVEIVDGFLQLNGLPGYLYQIDTVDLAAKTITLVSTVSSQFTFNPQFNPRLIRWDESGDVYQSDGKTVWINLNTSGDIPVPPSGTVLILENGITVAFDENVSNGNFVTGDFWTFAARTDGSIDTLTKAPPRGIHHHYAALSVVSFNPNTNTDCRTPWSPGKTSECGCCCVVTVGNGGQYSSINTAIQALPSGGEVCILPGIYYEYVFIQGRDDIVLRGCGSQTRIASPSLNPQNNSTTATNVSATDNTSGTTFSAVITVSQSSHVELKSFAIEADVDDVGVLLDGTGNLSTNNTGETAQIKTSDVAVFREFQLPGVVDTAFDDLVIVASNRPAILGQYLRLLEIDKCRIAMKNVRSAWPAVQVGGTDVFIRHNWVGALTRAAGFEWLPDSVVTDLSNQENAASGQNQTAAASRKAAVDFIPIDAIATGVKNPGGIQIAGFSSNVFIVENQIEDTGFNGITLGSYTVLDNNEQDTGIVLGVLTQEPDSCSTTIGFQPGGVASSAPQGSTLVAGGVLSNIHIDRNTIRNTGLCGIGPVALFDIAQASEIVSVENLVIDSNTISNTLLGNLAEFSKEAGFFAYGAICLPDVSVPIIRDNIITNFGPQPGAKVCGIYVLLGEQVDISRNQVLETRDWTESSEGKGAPIFGRAGIEVIATPPSYSSGSTLENIANLYEPGLPALRVEHNVVRVPLSQSFMALGFGPFSIVNNHFGCGGGVTDRGTPLAQTVLILNMGMAIESNTSTATFSGAYTSESGDYNLQTTNQLPCSMPFSAASSGLISTNISGCSSFNQLLNRLMGPLR